MTGIAVPAGRRVRRRRSAPAPVPREQQERPLAIELVLFAALAAGAAALWGRLVVDPPLARLAAMLAICVLGAAAAVSVARLARFPVLRRWALVTTGVATACAGAVALGVPARLLWLANWPELIDDISLGLGGIEDAELPYGGADPWIRLCLLLGAPVLIALAGTVAFASNLRPDLRRALALASLLVAWGVPATLDSPPLEIGVGLGLLVLSAAWLWLPDLDRRELWTAGAVIGATGALAVPVAAAVDPPRPWWDYETWDWFGHPSAVTYDWNHSYGPLDWPREGTTLLEIRSARSLYWRTTVLDRFDGFTWQRALPGDSLATAELAARSTLPRGDFATRHPGWRTGAQIEVRALRSEIAVGAGVTRDVDEIDDPLTSPDGTMVLQEELAPGDTYSINVYAPRPSARQMRRASRRYPDELRGATLVGLPVGSAFRPEVGPTSSGEDPAVAVGNTVDFAPSRAMSFGVWGRTEPEAERVALASQYGDVYRLAKRLTAGAPTAFDAAARIESYLGSRFEYTPNVPDRTYPLQSFLFQDRAGYCQQFSGAMALMLRMVGIPSRVVSGFTPGNYDADRGVFEVRDFDAHSWVEVYFPGIGWVTFDPTPGAAPAASQASGGAPTALLGDDSTLPEGSVGRTEVERAFRDSAPARARGATGDGAWATIAVVVGGIGVVGGTALGAVAWRRRRRLLDGHAADLQASELVAALRRLGWSVEPTVTLFGIERRFDRAGRRPIARYAAALRKWRYAADGAAPPGPGARRELRRALGAGGGAARRWRAWRAIPPGGPAARVEAG